MDNVEWNLGYDPRFGLIYVDYETQQRILKDSAEWYRQIIETNSADTGIKPSITKASGSQFDYVTTIGKKQTAI